MTGIPFTKYEVLGNDLVLVDERSRHVDDPAETARLICAHHTGAGSDGLLLLRRAPDQAAVQMRMFNPDGTEDFCGNGLLSTMAYLQENGDVRGGSIMVLSQRGKHDGRIILQSGNKSKVSADIVKPLFAPSQVPVNLAGDTVLDEAIDFGGIKLKISCVNTGSTHTVIFSERDVSEGTFRKTSPQIEVHPLFPERTSVLWCRVESRDKIWMRIWERGVGETFACGTGSCAALAAAVSTGRTERKAKILTRGGEVEVEWPQGKAVRLTSDVHRVYDGVFLAT